MAPRVTPQDVVDDVIPETLFRVPDAIRGDEDWENLFHDQVRRLRRDSQGLPLDTLQIQLIERVATLYIRLKFAETNGGLTPNQLAMLNDQYLKFVTQFQRVLQASDEALRQDLLQKMEKITLKAVDLVRDDDDRKAVRRHFQESFAALGY